MLTVIKAALKRDDRLAWMAAQYNAIAFHQPNDFPDDPAIEPVQTTSDTDVIYVRAWMKSLAERDSNGC